MKNKAKKRNEQQKKTTKMFIFIIEMIFALFPQSVSPFVMGSLRLDIKDLPTQYSR